jgi:hypothetical protein
MPSLKPIAFQREKIFNDSSRFFGARDEHSRVFRLGRPASFSRTIKLDNPASKELTGTATTDESAKDATLKVTFHATLK